MEFINKNGIELDVSIISGDENKYKNLVYHEVVQNLKKDATSFVLRIYNIERSLFNHPFKLFEDKAEYVAAGYKERDFLSYQGYVQEIQMFSSKFIEKNEREAAITRLFKNVETYESLFNQKIDKMLAGSKYLESMGIEDFDIQKFILSYIAGYILNSITDLKLDKIYINDYYYLAIYYDGITSSKLKKLVGEALAEFHAEFKTDQVPNFEIGTSKVKYIPNELLTAKDRFGNDINDGDLVISPQGGHNQGSWVEPFIVGRIANGRLYIAKGGGGSYYEAKRCIVLRSKFGNKLTYGDLDWM